MRTRVAVTQGFAFAASLLFAGHVAAAACCMSAATFGAGRLKIWEQAAVLASVDVEHSLGTFDSGRTFYPYGDYSDETARLRLAGMLRLSQRLQVFGQAPWVQNLRGPSGQAQVGGGIGDLVGGIRYEATGIGEYRFIPSIAFLASGIVPLSSRVEDGGNFGAAATGEGTLAATVGSTAEMTFYPLFVRGDASFRLPAPIWHERLGEPRWSGLVGDGGLALGLELLPETLVVACRVGALARSPVFSLDGMIADSQAARLTTSLVASWSPHSHFSIIGSAAADSQEQGWGMNLPAQLRGSLGGRIAFF